MNGRMVLCARCGITRHINHSRTTGSALCRDCRYTLTPVEQQAWRTAA